MEPDDCILNHVNTEEGLVLLDRLLANAGTGDGTFPGSEKVGIASSIVEAIAWSVLVAGKQYPVKMALGLAAWESTRADISKILAHICTLSADDMQSFLEECEEENVVPSDLGGHADRFPLGRMFELERRRAHDDVPAVAGRDCTSTEGSPTLANCPACDDTENSLRESTVVFGASVDDPLSDAEPESGF